MKNSPTLVVCAGALVLLSLTACYRKYNGRVVDQRTGAPVPNAIVEAYDARLYGWVIEDIGNVRDPDALQRKAMTPVATAASGANGEFSLTILRRTQGDLLVATRDGLEYSEPKEVRPGEPILLEWHLEPLRRSPRGALLEAKSRKWRFH